MSVIRQIEQPGWHLQHTHESYCSGWGRCPITTTCYDKHRHPSWDLFWVVIWGCRLTICSIVQCGTAEVESSKSVCSYPCMQKCETRSESRHLCIILKSHSCISTFTSQILVLMIEFLTQATLNTIWILSGREIRTLLPMQKILERGRAIPSTFNLNDCWTEAAIRTCTKESMV